MNTFASWKRASIDFPVNHRSHHHDVDELQLKIAQRQEQHLIPLKEDLADWLNKTLDVDDITTDNFMDKLDNGVIVCRLAKLIQQRAEECRRAGLMREAVPSFHFKCWENAKSETFFARDNTENFLRWCRKFGVHEAVIFESDGLVLHTQPRSVVLCLLELGRIASKFGIEPPGLVKLEKEIEEQEMVCSDSDSTSSSPLPPLSRANSSLSMTGEPRPVVVTNGTTNGVTPKRRQTSSELDQKVMHIADRVCHSEIKRISEGRYCIGGRIYFIRLLKGKHVMIRVGGGWDTLEHFLSRHDTCNVIVLNRRASVASDDGSILSSSPLNGSSGGSSPTSLGLSRPRYRSPASSYSLTSLTSLNKHS